MSFPAVLQLSSLDGSNGFRLDGAVANQQLGESVAGAGDVNGDGIGDLIIGNSGLRLAASGYVVFGQTGAFASSLAISSLDGSNGFSLPDLGIIYPEASVAGAGDVNGDGIDDVIVGLPSASTVTNCDCDLEGESTGVAYVAFGHTGSFAMFETLPSLDALVIYRAVLYGQLGSSVAGAGDVNGDGVDDVVLSASRAQQSYVVFGQIGSFTPAPELSTLNGMNGFVLDGAVAAVGAGDVNDDGIGDLAIIAPGQAASYVVFGRTGSFTPTLDLSAIDGTNGFVLNGGVGSIASAGDVNGDGIADIVIGFSVGDPDGRVNAGETFVVFGRTGGFGSALDLSSLDGSTGFRLDGIDGGAGVADYSGFSVAGLGDVNGDDIDDLLIGAPRADPGGRAQAGESYVVFGRTGGFASALNLSALNGTNGFRLDGIFAGDFSGGRVSGAGDVNGDGINDLIIGASAADPNGRLGAGQAFVVFGQAPTPGGNLYPDVTGPLSASTDEDAPAPFAIDLLQGATDPNDDPLSAVGFHQTGGMTAPSLTLTGNILSFDPDDFNALNAGQQAMLTFSYDISDGEFGVPQTLTLTIAGRNETFTGFAGDDTLDGTSGNDEIHGLAGNDTLEGLGGDDTLIGNAGADYLDGAGGNDSLNGGTGDDRLRGGGGKDWLSGEGGEDDLIGGKGSDTLSGGSSHDTLTGGEGADRFYFAPDATLGMPAFGDDPDVITDFLAAEGDRINLVKFNLPDYATLQGLFVDQGADTLIDLTPVGGRDILVEGVTLAELDQQTNFVL